MENQMTVEQALDNLQKLCDNFVGKKSDHIALDQTMQTIREAINKVNDPNLPKEK